MVVKKTATKTSTKSVAKKSSAKAKKTMVSVSGNMCFWVNNGPILSNLSDLENALHKMNDSQYMHHVSKGKNDFASWVKAVLHEPECATGLLKAKNRSEAATCVAKTITKYR